jgi:ABC-type multidrug transport system permease subunit
MMGKLINKINKTIALVSKIMIFIIIPYFGMIGAYFYIMASFPTSIFLALYAGSVTNTFLAIILIVFYKKDIKKVKV